MSGHVRGTYEFLVRSLQLAEEQRALAAAAAEKERLEKVVEQTKIDMLDLEKELRDKREKEGK